MEEAWKFWSNYGARIGFGVRKQWINKSQKTGKITSFRFVCCKEGIRKEDKRDHLTTSRRAETRTNCCVRIGFIYINNIEKYKVNDFIAEHNHPLHLVETTHMLACQRKVSQVQAYEIDMAEDSGIKQKASFELMSRQVGGRSNLGYTRLDQKNYIRSKRLRNLVYGEAGSLLQYFQQESLENPSFYYAVQLDVEEQITNIFWADARMIIDYAHFGDVVTLDTTYSTNNAYRPLAIFSGFNHFRGVAIFGAALLYDETIESFKWLFETFLEAHKRKKPQTIFTDQDHAMAKALLEVMPETYHGLCTWHLMQNGIKHLGNMMKNESSFLKDLKACMYQYEEECDFQTAWDKLLVDFNLQDNRWLNSLYKLKEKWAKCYMKNAFSIGMRSTQLSESLNSDLKSCLKPDLDIIQFFKHFERVICDKRYNELQCEFQSRQKLPRVRWENSPLLQQAAQIYTPLIFDIFQKEYDLYHAACIRHRNEGETMYGYVVGMFNKNEEFKVVFDASNNMIKCSCRKFETFGILCCHALKIFDIKDIKSIPSQYILKRWTREAKNGCVQDSRGKNVQEDNNINCNQRYRQLCPKLIRLATRASDCKEAYMLVNKVIDELSNQVDDICKRHLGLEDNIIDASPSIPNISESIMLDNQHFQNVKGIKKRDGVRKGRRPKSWVEKQSKKKKMTYYGNALQIHQVKVLYFINDCLLKHVTYLLNLLSYISVLFFYRKARLLSLHMTFQV